MEPLAVRPFCFNNPLVAHVLRLLPFTFALFLVAIMSCLLPPLFWPCAPPSPQMCICSVLALTHLALSFALSSDLCLFCVDRAPYQSEVRSQEANRLASCVLFCRDIVLLNRWPRARVVGKHTTMTTHLSSSTSHSYSSVGLLFRKYSVCSCTCQVCPIDSAQEQYM